MSEKISTKRKRGRPKGSGGGPGSRGGESPHFTTRLDADVHAWLRSLPNTRQWIQDRARAEMAHHE